jgi:hypothetical protein
MLLTSLIDEVGGRLGIFPLRQRCCINHQVFGLFLVLFNINLVAI